MKRLLVTLVVLALVALGADRGGDYVAEQVAASSLQSSQDLPQRPDVAIEGFPFLDQLARAHYDRVDVRVLDVPLGDRARGLRLASLDLVLDDVTTSRDFDRFAAERVRATALVSYADLSDALGIDVAYAGDGALSASRTFTVLGEEVAPSISIEPEVVDGALSLGSYVVDGRRATGPVAEALDAVLGAAVPLDGNAFDLALDSLQARHEGLRLGSAAATCPTGRARPPAPGRPASRPARARPRSRGSAG